MLKYNIYMSIVIGSLSLFMTFTQDAKAQSEEMSWLPKSWKSTGPSAQAQARARNNRAAQQARAARQAQARAQAQAKKQEALRARRAKAQADAQAAQKARQTRNRIAQERIARVENNNQTDPTKTYKTRICGFVGIYRTRYIRSTPVAYITSDNLGAFRLTWKLDETMTTSMAIIQQLGHNEFVCLAGISKGEILYPLQRL